MTADARWARATWAVVALGVGVRLAHFVQNHPVWYDESVLLVNVLSRDFVALLGPLDHAQAAPPLFLWALKAGQVLGGDVLPVWRLLPLLAGCGLVVLLAPLARRLLPAGPAFFVVLLAALSDRHVWYTSVIKPYTLDALLAGLLLYFVVATERWSLTRRCLVLAAVTPFALAASYPLAFGLAAVAVAWLPAAWRQRCWLGYGALGVSGLAAGLALYLGPIRAQRNDELMNYWLHSFPDWSRPYTLIDYSVRNTVGLLHFLVKPVGLALLVPGVVGGVTLARAKRYELLAVCVLPLAFAFLAATLKRYVYGEHRFILFLLPSLLLLAGFGFGPLAAWLHARWKYALVVGLVVPAAGLTAFHLAVWDLPDTRAVTAFVTERALPGDRYVTKNWGYFYYFRSRYEWPELLVLRPLQSGERVWVLVELGRHEEHRRWLWNCLPDHAWDVADEYAVNRASAFLCVRR